MDLRGAALELYGVLPGEFVATRSLLARQARVAGDRELAKAIGALPKPTLAAWAVNMLVRACGEEVEELLTVGARLREAQVAGAVGDFRDLNRTQHALLAGVRRHAEAVADRAGQRLSEPIAQRVQATLHAGMADPWAAEAVRSGLLVTDLASPGFGSVDLSGAIAVAGVVAAPGDDATPEAWSPRATPGADQAGHDRSEDAGRRAHRLAAEADTAVDDAAARLEAADATVEDLAREAAEREEEIARLTARLRELRAAQAAAGVRERRALAAREHAARALNIARQAAARGQRPRSRGRGAT